LRVGLIQALGAMKSHHLVTALLSLLLASCASKPTLPDLPKQELIGDYFMGDGLGVCMGIDLHADGTYKARFCGAGHLGGHPDTFEYGRWVVDKNHIFFYDAHGKYNASDPLLSYAETFYYKGLPAFVMATDLRNGRVYETFVFKRQDE
jgi:hypothetical protein